MAGDGSLKTIDKAAASVEAKLQIYFHKTKKELEDLLKSVKEWGVLVQILEKYEKLNYLSQPKAQKIFREMNEWPQLMELHLEIVNQYLAEEFALAAERFPEDFMDELQEIQQAVEGLLHGKIARYHPLSVPGLTEAIGKAQSPSTEYRTQLQNMEYLEYLLTQAIPYEFRHVISLIEFEEALDKKQHLITKQLLGNSYLERNIKLLLTQIDEAIKEQFQEMRMELPEIKITPTVRKDKVDMTFSLHNSPQKIPITEIGYDITITINNPYTHFYFGFKITYNSYKDYYNSTLRESSNDQRWQRDSMDLAELFLFCGDTIVKRIIYSLRK